jgi:hypothetical protein
MDSHTSKLLSHLTTPTAAATANNKRSFTEDDDVEVDEVVEERGAIKGERRWNM